MNYLEYLIETEQYNEIEIEIPNFDYFLATINDSFLKNGYIILEIKHIGADVYSFKFVSMVNYQINPDLIIGNKYDKLIKDLKTKFNLVPRT